MSDEDASAADREPWGNGAQQLDVHDRGRRLSMYQHRAGHQKTY